MSLPLFSFLLLLFVFVFVHALTTSLLLQCARYLMPCPLPLPSILNCGECGPLA